MANYETSAVIRVVDRASPVLRKINRMLDRLGASFGRAGRNASGLDRAGRSLRRVGSGGREAARGARSASRALVVVGNRSLTVATRMERVRGAAHRAAIALRSFGTTAATAMPRLSNTLRKVTLGLTVATGGLATAAFMLGRAVLGPSKQMEGYMVQIKALYGGDMAKARKAMDWIIEFAKKTPLELPQVIESFRLLKAMGIDPMNGSFQALVDTMAGLGIGFQGLQRVILSLGQAWSLGKLQGDTFREMATSGIDAAGLLAKALGKTPQQIREMGSKGKLGRREIALLIALLGKKFKGASEEYAKTWEGMTSNMSDAWWNFRREVGEAGFFDAIKQKLQSLLDTINKLEQEGTLDKWAKQLGNVLTKLVKKIVPDAESIEEALRKIDFEKIFDDQTIEKIVSGVESLKGLVPSMQSLAESAVVMADAFKAAADFVRWLQGKSKPTKKDIEEWRKRAFREPSFLERLGYADKGPTRYYKWDLMPGFELPEPGDMARKISEGAGETIVTRGPAIGQKIAEGIQQRASMIGNLIGQSAAEQIRAVIAGARLKVDALGPRLVGPRRQPAFAPVGVDAPSTPASE